LDPFAFFTDSIYYSPREILNYNERSLPIQNLKEPVDKVFFLSSAAILVEFPIFSGRLLHGSPTIWSHTHVHLTQRTIKENTDRKKLTKYNKQALLVFAAFM